MRCANGLISKVKQNQHDDKGNKVQLMKNLGLICLILLAVLGITDIGYAGWSQTLTINSLAGTGSYKVLFQQAVTNDDDAAGNLLDASIHCSWNWTSGTLNAAQWTERPDLSITKQSLQPAERVRILSL